MTYRIKDISEELRTLTRAPVGQRQDIPDPVLGLDDDEQLV